MQGIDTKQLDKLMSQVHKHIVRKSDSVMRNFAYQLLLRAIDNRTKNPNAHNYTGNLLTSIVVCLYKRGTPMKAYYANDITRKAILPKMTRRDRPWRYYKDYDLSMTQYTANIDTDRGWGINDAKRFFASYSPKVNLLYEVVVCYPVEYADFVESERSSAGASWTMEDAIGMAVTFVKQT